MKLFIRAIFTTFLAFAFSMGYAEPPGLQGKGGEEFPKGLENHEKTPSGWTHGEKHGWEHSHHHHHHHHKHHHDDVDHGHDHD